MGGHGSALGGKGSGSQRMESKWHRTGNREECLESYEHQNMAAGRVHKSCTFCPHVSVSDKHKSGLAS